MRRSSVRAPPDGIALAVLLGLALLTAVLLVRERRRGRGAERRVQELVAANATFGSVLQDHSVLADEARRLQVLEEVDEQRAALLRSVSHDLRTPLSTIRAVTSDLQAAPGYDRATQEELLGLVLDEAERLDRIVANLLSLSRIEAGALRPDRQAVELDCS